MARVGYYILSDAQAGLLSYLNIDYETQGGLPCVQDWDAVIEVLDERIWADGEITEEEGGWYDIMSESQNYMYWSTEAHSWV